MLHANQRRAASATQDGAKITIVADATDWSRAQLTPPLAARLLRRPLKLLVENSRNDRAFLLQIAEPNARRELQQALEAGWIEFEMGGGLQEIHHRIRGLTAEVGASPDHAMIELARRWIMFDRDAHPDDPSRESEPSGRVREQAAKLTIPWPLAAHQLERRAIENYVPPSVIREWWCARARSNPSRLDRERRAEAFLSANWLFDAVAARPGNNKTWPGGWDRAVTPRRPRGGRRVASTECNGSSLPVAPDLMSATPTVPEEGPREVA